MCRDNTHILLSLPPPFPPSAKQGGRPRLFIAGGELFQMQGAVCSRGQRRGEGFLSFFLFFFLLTERRKPTPV